MKSLNQLHNVSLPNRPNRAIRIPRPTRGRSLLPSPSLFSLLPPLHSSPPRSIMGASDYSARYEDIDSPSSLFVSGQVGSGQRATDSPAEGATSRTVKSSLVQHHHHLESRALPLPSSHPMLDCLMNSPTPPQPCRAMRAHQTIYVCICQICPLPFRFRSSGSIRSLGPSPPREVTVHLGPIPTAYF